MNSNVTAVRQHFPDMTQSLIMDVLAANQQDPTKALELLSAFMPSSSSSSLATVPDSSSSSQEQQELAEAQRLLEQEQDIHAAAVLAHVSQGGSPRMIAAPDLATLLREGVTYSASNLNGANPLPNGHWIWGGTSGSKSRYEGALSHLRTAKPPQATVNVLRLNLAPYSFLRHDVLPCPRTCSRVTPCGEYSLFSVSNGASAPVIIDPRTAEVLGEIQPPTAASPFVTYSPPATTSTAIYFAAAHSVDKYNALSIVVQATNVQGVQQPQLVQLKSALLADEEFEDLGAPPGVFVAKDSHLFLILTDHWIVILASSYATQDSTAFFVSRQDVRAALTSKDIVVARQVFLPNIRAISDAHADIDDNKGSKVRLFLLSTPNHLLSDCVQEGEELRNGGKVIANAGGALPTTDQSPVDQCPRIISVDCEPLLSMTGSVVLDTAAIRGAVAGVPFSADRAIVRSSFWLSQGTWPELDSIRTAQQLKLDNLIGRRQKAAIFSTNHDGALTQVWESPVVCWLSGLTQIPATVVGSQQRETWIAVTCSRYDIATKSVVDEFLIFHSSNIQDGPAYVISAPSPQSTLNFGFDSPKGCWIPLG